MSHLSDDVQFAVVDVETTGLFPEASDRVIEIAILRSNLQGEVSEEYQTLINPNRDLGPTRIHGISASDVRGAPVFEQIAGDVLSRLRGALLVGHNVRFDQRFLKHEFLRIGVDLPSIPMLCTINLAFKGLPGLPGRRLETCCAHAGINITHSHSASEDARATHQLLHCCLKRLNAPRGFRMEDFVIVSESNASTWPQILPSGKSVTRQMERPEVADFPFIARLVADLPLSAEADPNLEGYLSLLDSVLEDRRVTSSEVTELQAAAFEYGITRDKAVAAHYNYLKQLIQLGLRDGIVTTREMQDLREVSTLLSIPFKQFDQMLAALSREMPAAPPSSAERLEDITGKSICFTGALTCRINGSIPTRGMAQEQATKRGMIVKDSVTKKLDYLVVADPDSMSGKAKKARETGTRIIAEPVFWRLMGIEIE